MIAKSKHYKYNNRQYNTKNNIIFRLSKKKAAIITIGIENLIGANPKAIAMDNAPNETCDKPSPIIEYLFKTRLTPKRAAQSDTNNPPIKALCINPWANISLIICCTSQKHI